MAAHVVASHVVLSSTELVWVVLWGILRVHCEVDNDHVN
jgi:hypothetical protein